jgi:hypothetical protein
VIELTGLQAVADSLILQRSILCAIKLTPRALLSVKIYSDLFIYWGPVPSTYHREKQKKNVEKNGKPESGTQSIFQNTLETIGKGPFNYNT